MQRLFWTNGGRRRWLATALLLGLAGTGALVHAEEKAPAAAGAERTVRLIVDYGDGVEKHFTRIAWSEGMTVLDALQSATRHPRGIAIQQRGSGATAFLLQIDEVKNQGSGRNWIYRVNGKLADRGFGIQLLRAGDEVRWEFAEYR